MKNSGLLDKGDFIFPDSHENLVCKYCGTIYQSRGKDDPGYCRDCETSIKTECSLYSEEINK